MTTVQVKPQWQYALAVFVVVFGGSFAILVSYLVSDKIFVLWAVVGIALSIHILKGSHQKGVMADPLFRGLLLGGWFVIVAGIMYLTHEGWLLWLVLPGPIFLMALD